MENKKESWEEDKERERERETRGKMKRRADIYPYCKAGQ